DEGARRSVPCPCRARRSPAQAGASAWHGSRVPPRRGTRPIGRLTDFPAPRPTYSGFPHMLAIFTASATSDSTLGPRYPSISTFDTLRAKCFASNEPGRDEDHV